MRARADSQLWDMGVVVDELRNVGVGRDVSAQGIGLRRVTRMMATMFATLALVAVVLPGIAQPASAAGAAPQAITSFSVDSRTETSLTLKWTAPADGGSAITTYAIERSNDGVNWTAIDRPDSTSTTYTVTGLTLGVQVTFRIAARNVNGVGPSVVLNPASSISVGFQTGCEVTPATEVWCWGENIMFKVGSVHAAPRKSPQSMGITGAAQVVTGYNFVCVRYLDGSVGCFGRNNLGMLGDGTTNDSADVRTVQLGAQATQIATNYATTCALLVGGTVKCWGSGAVGQLGNGATPNYSATPVTVQGLTGATQISVGSEFACALLISGRVNCWGRNTSLQLGVLGIGGKSTPVAVDWVGNGLAKATQISSGNEHSCAVLEDSTMTCWGANSSGQVSGYLTPVGVPNDVPTVASPVREVRAAGRHSCAVLTSGMVSCWGDNSVGQLGRGNTTTSPRPALVPDLGGVLAMTARYDSTCVIAAQGAVRCWGAGGVGQLANGSFSNSSVPSIIREVPSGTPIAPTDVRVSDTTDTTISVAWNAGNANGQIIDVYRIELTTDGASEPTLVDIVGRTLRSYTLTGITAGHTYTVGVRPVNRNGNGTVGTASTSLVIAPGAIRSLAAVSRDAGSIGLRWIAPASDGGGAIFDHAVEIKQGLGDWTAVTHDPIDGTTFTVTGLTPGVRTNVRVAPINAKGQGPWIDLDRAVGVSSGADSSCDVLADGAVECWGKNDHGQLGVGSTDLRTTPARVVRLEPARSVSVGSFFACAALWNGTVSCWGDNTYGQLGDGSTTSSSSPVQVSGITTAKQVVTGAGFACALLADDSVRCWGSNSLGQLANDSDKSVIPVTISGVSAASITAGLNHACVVGLDTNAYCWGFGSNGQIGNGTNWFVNGVTRVSLGGAPVSTIAAGYAHTCAVLGSGLVKCWGSNDKGALGNGGGFTGTQKSPSSVDLGGVSAVSLTAGNQSTCAVLAGGALSCWGRNLSGELGAGTTSNYDAPHQSLASGVSIADAGSSTVCIIDDNARTSCAGTGVDDRLGTGTTDQSNVFVPTLRQAPGVDVVGEPAPPTALTVTATTTTSVSLSWTAPTYGGGCDLTDYEILYTDGNPDWTPFAHTASTSTSATVTGLRTLTPYVFVVRAVNTCATGSPSGIATVRTQGVPGSVTEVMKIGNATTSMNLIWVAPTDDGGDGIEGYDVDWSTNGVNWSDGPFSGTTSRTITGLAPNTAYTVRVGAINHNGTGQYVTETFRTAGPPAAPTGLVRASATNTSANLTWTAPTETSNVSITDYLVQYRIGQNAWSSVAHTNSASAAITLSGLAALTTYSVRIAAVTTHGTGDYLTGSFTTSGAPNAPTGLAVTGRTTTSVSLSWVAPQITNGSTISTYKVESRVGSGSWTTFTHSDSTATSITVTGLTAGASMSFRVSASSNYGDSVASSSVTQLTAVAPTAPGSLSVTARTKTSIALSWKAPSGSFGAAITDYVISLSTNGQTFTTANDATSTATTATLTGLTAGTRYWVKVQAVNSQGAGLASNTVDGWTSVLPGALSGGPFVMSKTTTSVRLTWNPPLDSGGRPITNYTVQYLKAGAVSWTTFNHLASTLNELDITGLTKGASYSFRVAAVTDEGTGVWATLNSVVVAVKPGAPTGLLSSAKTTTSMTLKWTAPTDNGGSAITDYVIEYRRSSVQTWTTFADGVSTALTATVIGLTRNVSYVFRVSAKNAEGTSLPSSTGTFTPSSLSR